MVISACRRMGCRTASIMDPSSGIDFFPLGEWMVIHGEQFIIRLPHWRLTRNWSTVDHESPALPPHPITCLPLSLLTHTPPKDDLCPEWILRPVFYSSRIMNGVSNEATIEGRLYSLLLNFYTAAARPCTVLSNLGLVLRLSVEYSEATASPRTTASFLDGLDGF